MGIIIKRLAPELAADYFDFFDNRAFSDGSPYAPCYCGAFNMSKEQIKKEFFDQAAKDGGGAEAIKKAMRRSAERLVAQNIIQGYLAYDGDTAIGWCNANDRCSYARVGEFSLDDVPEVKSDALPERGTVKAIVCFEIAPDYRGRGIASALLERVCQDAKEDGFAVVEAYPVARDTREALDFTGPVRLYEKAGFLPVRQEEKMLVMQKRLQ